MALGIAVALKIAAYTFVGIQPVFADDVGSSPPKINPYVIPKGAPFITPMANFADRADFQAMIYDGMPISSWDPFKEFPFAGKIAPIDNRQQRKFYIAMREREFDDPEELNVMLENLRCFASDCILEMVPDTWHRSKDSRFFCNDFVSLYRTSLYVRGIISRPVYFEFSDNVRGNSHTLVEVWSEEKNKWLYFDPFYGAYSLTRNIAEILEAEDMSEISFVPGVVNDMKLAARRAALTKTFDEGWHQWTVPNMVSGVKFTFRNPKIYGDSTKPSSVHETPAANIDRRF